MSGGWLLQRGVAERRQRLPAGPAVRRRARPRQRLLRGLDRRDRRCTTRPRAACWSELKDPYSVLLTGDDYKALTEQTSGNYAGLGIQIDVRDGWITVVAPLPETPAERAGVQTGDQIIEVDGKSTEGWKNDQAVKALRGEAGSKVTITVRRVGRRPIPSSISLTRAQIHMRSVPPGTHVRRRRRIHLAQPRGRDLGRRAARARSPR